MTRLFFLSSLVFGLAACESGPTLEARLATAKSLHPQDADLNEIYQRSCRACHIQEETGAPLVGDKKEWATRYEKGESVLLENVIHGFAGMPPFGLCMECTPEQFQQLIRFMAQR